MMVSSLSWALWHKGSAVNTWRARFKNLKAMTNVTPVNVLR